MRTARAGAGGLDNLAGAARCRNWRRGLFLFVKAHGEVKANLPYIRGIIVGERKEKA
jgi:hypothetical protein